MTMQTSQHVLFALLETLFNLPTLSWSERSFGKALPKDHTGAIKRVIVVDGIDRNPYVFAISSLM